MYRFLWTVEGDMRRLKIAALIQFALPHPPIISYGTEVAPSQWHDLEYPNGTRRMEQSRTPMLWGGEQDLELRYFYKALINYNVLFKEKSGEESPSQIERSRICGSGTWTPRSPTTS